MDDRPKVWNIHGGEFPPNAVYIGRPTVFGNPFHIGRDGNRQQVVAAYREWLAVRMLDDDFRAKVEALRGQHLLCFCKPYACHGDVLLEVANRDEETISQC